MVLYKMVHYIYSNVLHKLRLYRVTQCDFTFSFCMLGYEIGAIFRFLYSQKSCYLSLGPPQSNERRVTPLPPHTTPQQVVI